MSSPKKYIIDDSHCIDCGIFSLFLIIGTVHPQWVSVNNGVYVCYNCSGIHRGFGVQISFIRSLSMDSISEKQQKILFLGGNKRFFDYIQCYNLHHDSPNAKYKSRAAEYYRTKLKAEVENEEFNITPPENEEGREILKGYEESKHSKSINTKQYGNGSKKKGFLDKMLDVAKDFGEMTKNAAENIWEKGKSLKDDQRVNAITTATTNGLTKAGKELSDTGKVIANVIHSVKT